MDPTDSDSDEDRFLSRIESALEWNLGDVFALQTMASLGGGFVPWSTYSLRPAALLLILNEIAFRPCRTVVEFGSGASTAMIARLLAQVDRPGGRVISFEHDHDWARSVNSLLSREGLKEIATVVHAPLSAWPDRAPRPDSLGEVALPERWYDTRIVGASLDELKIDLLIVDGPPADGTASRYPALPALRHRLDENAVVILDDANREPDRRTAAAWGEALGTTVTLEARLSLAVARLGGGYSLVP